MLLFQTYAGWDFLTAENSILRHNARDATRDAVAETKAFFYYCALWVVCLAFVSSNEGNDDYEPNMVVFLATPTLQYC